MTAAERERPSARRIKTSSARDARADVTAFIDFTSDKTGLYSLRGCSPRRPTRGSSIYIYTVCCIYISVSEREREHTHIAGLRENDKHAYLTDFPRKSEREE